MNRIIRISMKNDRKISSKSEVEKGKDDTKRDIYRIIGRIAVRVCTDYCQVDLYAFNKLNRREFKPTRLSRIFMLINIYSSIRIFLVYLFQFRYFYDRKQFENYRRSVFDWQDMRILHNKTELYEMSRQFKAAIENDREILNLIGAPLLDFTSQIQCLYSFLLLINLLTYFQTKFMYKYYIPFNVSILRILDDEENERIYWKQVMDVEMGRFIASSREFLHNNIRTQKSRFSYRLKDLESTSQQQVVLDSSKLIQNHDLAVRELKRMSSNGFLEPSNKCPDWLDTIFKAQTAFWILYQIWSVMIVSFLEVLMPYFCIKNGKRLNNGAMDVLVRIESFIQELMISLTCGLWLFIILFNALDQIHLINGMIKRIKQFIKLSNDYMREKCDDDLPTRRDDSSVILRFHQKQTELNSSLLFVYMHFKCLTKQVTPLRGVFGTLALVITEIIMIMPLIVRFQAHYLETDNVTWAVICCLAFLFLSYISLIPICYMNSRGFILYKVLFTLIAQTKELDSGPDGKLLDDHLLMLLRREISDPTKLIEHFTTKIFQISFNYSTFLRVQFWCGLLILVTYLSPGVNIFDKSLGLI